MNDLRDISGKFSPHPTVYKDFVKLCLNCGATLVLQNNRDIVRKNYCCRQCRSKGSAKTEAFRANTVKPCARCGEEFRAMTFSQRYCSPKCCGAAVMMSYRKRRMANPEGFFRAMLRANNKRNGLTLDLLLKMFEDQKGLCALSGENMTMIVGQGHTATNVSIDRIDSSKGYTPDNIQLVCKIVNVMKHNLASDQLVEWCRKIIKRVGG